MKADLAPDIARRFAQLLYCALSDIRSLPGHGLHARGGLLPALRETRQQHHCRQQECADKTWDQLRCMVRTQSGWAIPEANQGCFQPGKPTAAFALRLWPLP